MDIYFSYRSILPPERVVMELEQMIPSRFCPGIKRLKNSHYESYGTVSETNVITTPTGKNEPNLPVSKSCHATPTKLNANRVSIFSYITISQESCTCCHFL